MKNDTSVYMDNGELAQALIVNEKFTEAREYLLRDLESSYNKSVVLHDLIAFDFKHSLNDTLVSTYNYNNSIKFSYNQTWYREFDVSLPLHKGQYDIHLSVTTPVEDTMWSSLNFNPNSVEVLNFKLSTHNKRRK